MAAQPPNTDITGVRAVLNICGCNNELKNAITNKDIKNMSNFSILTKKDIKTLAKNISSLPVAQ